MGNKSVLEAARKKMQDIAYKHLVENILIPFAYLAKLDAEQRRENVTHHNMTGNTVNSYAAAVFFRGKLVWDSIRDVVPPLRNKLRKGERFFAGNRRWDGDEQSRTFTAPVDTDARMEPAQSLLAIQSHRPQSDIEILVTNGVEYATWQESMMGIDVLTANFTDMQSKVKTIFKPLPD